MKNGISKHFTDAILFVFICFSSLLTAKDDSTIHSHYSNSILELLNTLSTTPAEELRSAPSGSLSYSVGGIAVSSVKQGDIVIVSATFSEPMADSPIVQITGYGVTEISLTNMTKVSTTSYTYSWTVGSGDGTQVFELATGTDLEGNVITSIPSSGDSVLVDNTRPTALISWGETNTVSPGDVVTVEFDFSEAMADSPLPQISGSGVETIALANMVKLAGDRYYKYTWTVGNNLGEQTFSVATGTDLAGNITEATLTAGASIFITNPPAASLVYTVGGNVVSEVGVNDELTITATFDYEIKDSPLMQIKGSGVETILTSNMTKVSSTVYNYTYTVGSGVGAQKFYLETGQGLYGDVVTSIPSSGGDIIYKSILNSSYEDFALNNPNAIKINAIFLTNDPTLVTVPLTADHAQGIITSFNTAYNELYDSTNWPGFELARVTKAYDPTYYFTDVPASALYQIGSQSVAQQNYLNLVFLDIDADQTQVVGQTLLNGSTIASNGATILLNLDGGDAVAIHEMGHVIGVSHIAGSWPPVHHELSLQDGVTMGYHTFNHSNVENSYMSNWNSAGNATTSLYLTEPSATLKTPTYGALFSEAFRSWLINNQYILANAPGTGYGGRDTSLSVASDWEGGAEFSSLTVDQTYPKIVTSQNGTNNYAAVSFTSNLPLQLTSTLSYSYRDINNDWEAVTTIEGVANEFQLSEMAMNSNGDVIIITEPFAMNQIKVFYKAFNDASWTNSLVISDTGTSDLNVSNAKVSMNSAGDVAAVWLRKDTEEEIDKTYIVFKERVAGTWSSAEVLSLDDGENELPSIAYNDNGDVLVSWQQWNASSSKYEVVGKFRNGTNNVWTSSESYGNTSHHAGFSQVAIDPNGNALVYWRQAAPSIVRPNLPTRPLTGFLNVRYRNSDGTLETTVQLTNTAEDAFNGATEENENRVIFLEDGTAAVTWWENDGTNPSTIFTSSMPSKNVWTAPFALSNSGQNATLSKISRGNGGDYSVIWQRADGLNTRIQTRAYHADTNNWSAISTLSNSGSDALWGDIAYDGDNQFSAVWTRKSGLYLPEVKQLSSKPFITKTTIATDNTTIAVSFNESVYNTNGGTGALEATDFILSITGGIATLASTTPTSISSNGNVYTLGVSLTGTPDGTEILTVSPDNMYDSAGNVASIAQSNNSVALNEKISHTAILTYTVGGTSVSKVSENDVVTLTATFNQVMADSPIVQVSGSGVNSISASNMTKVTSTSYTYSWIVGAGSGVQTFALATGTNSEETVITPTPSLGATIIVVNNIAPTVALTHTITKSISPQNAESSVSAAKEGDIVTINALFSEEMADFPGIQISGSGVDLFYPINMTKVSSTEYTFDWRVNVAWDGNNFATGIKNFTLGTGTDLGGNVITATPTSGESITIDNTSPTLGPSPELGLVYTIDGNIVDIVREGDQVLITATFSEDISDQGCKINGYGSTTIPFSDMTKVSTTEYTYLWTVGAGNGNTDFGVGYGTDIVGNQISNNYMNGRNILVDNSSPTALIDWNGVTTVAPGSSVIVYVTFSETMANNPVPQISGTGAHTIAATDLVQHYLNIYKYVWTVGENAGTQTFSVSTGTDLVGNLVEETLTSGGSILIDILPTAALSYTVNGNAVSSANLGDEVLITALFNKEMADSPVVQIYAEGLNATSAADMTKINSTSYTYTLTAGSGNGNQYFRMATGTDLAGTIIQQYPTSGETLIIDNTPPTITLLGDPIVDIAVGATYTDASADANDNVDGPVITDSIVVVSTVNTSVIGSYTVTYNVSDAAGNAATQVSRTVNVVDTTIPTITLTGDATITIQVGTTYEDAGATATDNYDGDITASITTVNNVDINTVGIYAVTYNVSDASGNAATEVSRTVNIVEVEADTTIPIITLTGDGTITIELGTAYSELGATAIDNIDGDISASIVIDATAVDVNTVGSYTVTYNVSDAAVNAAVQVIRTVNVEEETTIPVITLIGANPQSIELGTAYGELGATAIDNIDGDISASIVIDATAVDVNTVGNYTVNYNVSDAAGNHATQVTRTVIIATDVTIPVITLTGAASISLELGTAYTDAGATASDNTDGDITNNITTVNPVDVNTVGTYTITYNVSDAAGNAATQVTRTVIITAAVDSTIPLITLEGDASISLELGTAYTDAGATALDNTDGDITNNIVTVNPVDENIEGTYTITYNVSDAAGNAATQVTRTVIITADVTLPVITLTGAASISLELGTAYTDAGATASDNTDGSITNNIVTVNPVDENIEGTYTITYNVSDAAGNPATQVTRTVIITADVTIPVITLTGAASISHELGSTYTDAGATASDNADGDITNNITTVNPVNINALGTYTITYNVSDAAGNAATQVIRTVNVMNEITIPVITLTGDASISLLLGATYIDAGATASDNADGDITNNITTVNPVNINALGTYTITYNVSDAAGNTATQVTRTVVVSVNEDYCEISEDFESFPLVGWTVFNSNTASNNITQSDSWSNDGAYSLRFSSKDLATDSAYDQYLLSPEITTSDVQRALSFFYSSSNGGELFKVGWSTTGNNLDTDFTWSDEIIGIVEGSDGNEFNEYSKTDLPAGTKYIAIHYYSNHQNYLYIDRLCLLSVTNSGSYNSGITLLGAENISLGLGTTYTDAGAIAFDEDGVDITADIVTVNPVDKDIDGVYTITYNVIDALGNAATEVKRTVTIFTNMWNGSSDNNWDTIGNWSTNSVPGVTARVRIPKTGIINFPTASSAVTINALTIESGASLIAASTFLGTITYNRNLPLVNDWHFVSSPVVGASIEDVINNTDLATGSGTNLGLSIYNNNTPGWEYYSTTNSTGTLGSGIGYSLLVNSGNISFTGTMPTEQVNTSITKGIGGWNLIGNPYPSYLAMNNKADGTNFIDVNSSILSSNYVAVYLWDAINSTVKVVNHASDSYDMSPGQGFFVNVSTVEGSASFTEAMQSHQATETFYRTVNDVPTVELAAFNGTQVKSTIVKYFEFTGSGLDIGYDAGLFTNGDDAFKLSTHLVKDSEGVDFALQALNINEFETSIIPVALTGVAGSKIVFSVESLNLPADIKVFLEDKTTTTFTRLDEANSEYIVTLTEAENGIGRFYLHTAASVLNTNDINLNNISIYKADSSTIRIVGLPDGKSTFKLFNILGVTVIKTTFIANGVSEIKLPLLPAAVYIVQLENEFGKVIKKIILE